MNHCKRWLYLWVIAVLFSGLQACGGGSGNTSAPGVSPAGLRFLLAPDTWVQLGNRFEYLPVIEGAAASPAYRLAEAPAGMQLDASSGYISWTPSSAQLGSHVVRLEVTADGQTLTQELLIVVSGSDLLLEQSVPVGGATLSVAGVRLTVAPGAIATTTRFRIERLSGTPDYSERTDVAALGAIYAITARDNAGNPITEFAVPLSLTLDYDPNALPAGLDPNQISAYLVDIDLEPVIVHAVSSVDPVRHQVTFTTPHLSDFMLGYPSGLLYTAIVDDGRFFIQHRGPLDDMAAINRYSSSVLAAAQAAEALALQRGFLIPAGIRNSTVTIRIHSEAPANGHYDPLSGIIYVHDSLDATHVRTTTAHEYFHKIQDQYYTMSAELFTRQTWWYESTAPWYESLIDPEITQEKINSGATGYLRTPLFSKKRDDSYPKGTMVEYFETRVSDFVRKTFEDNDVVNSITDSITDSIDKSINLNANYPHYVNWALEKYGPGTGLGVIDGALSIEEGNVGIYSDRYDADDKFLSADLQIIDPDIVDGVLRHTISDRSALQTHRARIYKITPSASNSATTKTLRIRFSRRNQVSPNTPYVLALDAAGKRVSLQALTPEDSEFYRVRRFGTGAGDVVSTVYLILTEMDAAAVDVYEWQVEAVEQPPLADIEIDLPAEDLESSEIRTLQAELFAFPSIAADLSADPVAQGFGLFFTGIKPQAADLSPGWSVTGISRHEPPVTYADPDAGFLNNNNAGALRGFLPGLNDFQHFAITAFACDSVDQNCGSRGLTRILYLDGPVEFSYAISPAQVVPRHVQSSPFLVVPTTPVTIELTINNGSSLPVVVNSLELVVKNTGLLGNELSQTGATPALVVRQGETRSLTFSDVELVLPVETYGTRQRPRLLIGFDNCPGGVAGSGCGLTDTTLGAAAAFWAGTFSQGADLEVLTPP